MTDGDNLKPCPFCGCDELSVRANGGFEIRCHACDISGPRSVDLEGAWENWNERAAPPLTERARREVEDAALADGSEPLPERLCAAAMGAYHAAPDGEGRGGGEVAALGAIALVLGGMSPSAAVTEAIGDSGTYGVRRTRTLIPRPSYWATGPDNRAMVTLGFKNQSQRDECLAALED